MRDISSLKNSDFPDLISQESKGSSAFSRYEDPAYVAAEIRNLITISLTHCPDLVHKIEKDSPESEFLMKNFGIDYPYKAPIGEDQTPMNIVPPAPRRNTLTHSFNHVAVDKNSVSQDALNNMEKLDDLSRVTRDICAHKYQSFGQVLDDLFPNWKTEGMGNLSLDDKSQKVALLESTNNEIVYKDDDGEDFIIA